MKKNEFMEGAMIAPSLTVSYTKYVFNLDKI